MDAAGSHRPVAAVVIPAHDEAGVIGRCLSTLLSDAREGELEVAVVANGCTDDTAEIARGFAPPVTVVEIDVASKVAALNAGDAAVVSFPRIYLDADIEVDIQSVRRVAAALADEQAPTAAATARWELGASSVWVRAFYRAFLRLPYARTTVASGMYALSQRGRERFDAFPELTADDLFVRNLFSDDERLTVSGASIVVRAPRDLRSLLAVRRRVYRGNAQYAASGWESQASKTFDLRTMLKVLLSDPVAAIVYLAVNALAKLQVRSGAGASTWERDESSRS